jgi:hypothetical protein
MAAAPFPKVLGYLFKEGGRPFPNTDFCEGGWGAVFTLLKEIVDWIMCHNTQHGKDGSERLVRSRGAQTTCHCCLGPDVYFSSFRNKSESVGHIYASTDPPSQQERVGGPYLCVNRPMDPPSLQTRAGGPYLHPQPHPRSKRE